MQIGLLEKVFFFFAKLVKECEQLSWLVKKTLFSNDNIFKNVPFFKIYTI